MIDKLSKHAVPSHPLIGAEFIAGATQAQALPQARYPEVAFAGRSNVGKSSLINAVLGRKALARVSRTPGRTRQINFFQLPQRLCLVDLPGYGYAQASKKMVTSWGDLISDYLRERAVLRCVYILVDSRHGLKSTDQMLMTFLDDIAVPYQIVLTKADKAARADKERLVEHLESLLSCSRAGLSGVMATSAEKHQGLGELQQHLLGWCIDSPDTGDKN